ncbi:hypothetical protein M413DRAFT_440419 [Hebeloma cylindrosporum]|uniref:NADH dehydrogenase [ubiquinone] 1 alpha subcomplex subunit n=1 Tax=Hebeloma cylindrosporum TaxID=76867 RepID=A0A0C3CDJ4_HEBCY|nr:hypothetical protein M413DRAFT_440419 [Hebeloma cylindrosporum h7]
MSFFTKVWNAIRNPVRYKGRDLQGNKYFEMRNPNDPTRKKRIVRYGEQEDMWKYIGGAERLPVQWSAWLTHTRPNPPTLEELQADAARQQRVAENVDAIEARDRAEEEEMLRIRQRDAKLALEEAAASASRTGRPLNEVTSIPEPSDLPEVTSTSRASSSEHEIPTKKESVESPTLLETPSAQKPKILPPAFLTPGTPRKPKSAVSTPFTPPSIVNASEPPSHKETPQVPLNAPPNARIGSQHQKEAEWTESLKKGTPLPSMPSRPVSNTESWTPKARRRG